MSASPPSHPLSTPTSRPTYFVICSWAVVLGWACLIFFMSSNTSSGLNQGLGVFSQVYQVMKDVQAGLFGPGVDVLSSIAHFCEYTVFGALLANALRCHLSLRRACFVAIVCASAYGVTDEIHQLFVPGRMCDPVDWLVDTVGATVGAGLLYVVLRSRTKR